MGKLYLLKTISLLTLIIMIVTPIQRTSAISTIDELPPSRLTRESPMDLGGWMDAEKVQLTDNGTHIFVWTTHYGNQPNESNKRYQTRLYIDADRNTTTGMDVPGIEYVLDFFANGDGHEIWMDITQWNETTQEKTTSSYYYPDLPEGFEIIHEIGGNYIGLGFPISAINLTLGQTFDFHIQTGSKIQARLDQQVTYTIWNNTDIIVDGESDDWAGISPIIVDPVEQSQIAEFDLSNFYITDNGLTLFLRFDTRGTPTSSLNWDFRFERSIVAAFDLDQDNETGRRIGEIGQEYHNIIRFSLPPEGPEAYSYRFTYDESGNDESSSYDDTSAAWGSVFEWNISLSEEFLNISIGDTIDIYIDEFDEEFIEFFYEIPLLSYTITPGSACLELGAGWNMVSLPVLPDDPLASSVLSDVEFYQLVTWSGTGYTPATTFEAGRGYWLLVLEDANLTLSGTHVGSLNLTLSPGWSMIGGISSEMLADDVFPDFFQLVTWTGTGYTPATVFEPGKGYWALVLEETQIQLPP